MSERTNIALEEHHDYTGAKIGMWLFLFTEILLFGGLFLVYSVYRARNPAEFQTAAAELSLIIGAVNTVILLTSSLTMALSISAIRRSEKKASVIFQAITIVLAIVFLVNKYFEWGAKIGHGIYPNAPELLAKPHGEILFYGLYYVMTGLHAIHVLAGIVLLTIMLAYTIRGSITAQDFVKLENSGLYWHLVDIIWIYLFPLLYLIT